MNLRLTERLQKLWPLTGGVHIAEEHKSDSNRYPSRAAALPKRMVLPLRQHIGQPAHPVVKVGQRVLTGQLLAHPSAALSAALHAPTSGTIVAIQSHPIPHPSGLEAECLILEVDGLDECAFMPPIEGQPTPEQIRQRALDAGLVGLGGATFPTALKLNPSGPIELLLINGVECEPYITCDDLLMREQAEAVIEGTQMMRLVLGAELALIVVEDNKPEACAALRAVLQRLEEKSIEVRVIPTHYPSGGERQLIERVTGIQLPPGGRPGDFGMVCNNVGTTFALQQAVRLGKPLIERYVTVTGAGVVHPKVLRARFGTPFSDLIAQCGGYTAKARQLIVGGPMMGFSAAHDDLPFSKGTNCLLVSEQVPETNVQPCIRCGTCVKVCPSGLLPQQMYWYSRAHDYERLHDYHLFSCIECGCCASVCPSHIPLVQYYRHAKGEINRRDREQRHSERARVRYETKQARIAREKAETAARLAQRKAQMAAAAAAAEAEKAAAATADAAKPAAVEAATTASSATNATAVASPTVAEAATTASSATNATAVASPTVAEAATTASSATNATAVASPTAVETAATASSATNATAVASPTVAEAAVTASSATHATPAVDADKAAKKAAIAAAVAKAKAKRATPAPAKESE